MSSLAGRTTRGWAGKLFWDATSRLDIQFARYVVVGGVATGYLLEGLRKQPEP